uniref:Uncharacterized protein n=1 Tax=Macrostomum lignano TaxID=282301 RepID=A0A1I8F6K9_9PLAT
MQIRLRPLLSSRSHPAVLRSKSRQDDEGATPPPTIPPPPHHRRSSSPQLMRWSLATSIRTRAAPETSRRLKVGVVTTSATTATTARTGARPAAATTQTMSSSSSRPSCRMWISKG